MYRISADDIAKLNQLADEAETLAAKKAALVADVEVDLKRCDDELELLRDAAEEIVDSHLQAVRKEVAAEGPDDHPDEEEAEAFGDWLAFLEIASAELAPNPNGGIELPIFRPPDWADSLRDITASADE